MRDFFKLNLKFDLQITVVSIASSLLLVADFYFHLTREKELDRSILYLIIPILIILFIFRKRLKDFGFQLGDWRAGLIITLGSCIILAPILYLAVHLTPEMQQYYQTKITFEMMLWNILGLFAWEFFCRGFIYFGYAHKLGDDALWLQAVPFALAHLQKPALETISTLITGFLFALVARKTRSFIYPFLIHYFITTATLIFASMHQVG